MSNTNFMKKDFDFSTAVVNNARTDKKLWSWGCYFEDFKVQGIQRTVVISLVSYIIMQNANVAGQTVL